MSDRAPTRPCTYRVSWGGLYTHATRPPSSPVRYPCTLPHGHAGEHLVLDHEGREHRRPRVERAPAREPSDAERLEAAARSLEPPVPAYVLVEAVRIYRQQHGGETRGRKPTAPETVRKIQRLSKEGRSLREIAAATGAGRGTVAKYAGAIQGEQAGAESGKGHRAQPPGAGKARTDGK
jgi:hypothetical protein